MAEKELGKVLGDAISGLENASMSIDDTISQLLDIDGKVILLKESDDEIKIAQPSMTIEELGEIIEATLSELKCIVLEIESAQDLLQTINGTAITVSKPDNALGIDN